MIKVFVMESCQDCAFIKEQIKDDPDYEIIDVGQSIKNLKAFLRYRDNSPLFDGVKEEGYAGLPCFVFEDGTLTLNPEDLGLESRPGVYSCSIFGRSC